MKAKLIHDEIKSTVFSILRMISSLLTELFLNSLDKAIIEDIEREKANVENEEEIKTNDVHIFYPKILYDKPLNFVFASYLSYRSLDETQIQIHDLYQLAKSCSKEINEYKNVIFRFNFVYL